MSFNAVLERRCRQIEEIVGAGPGTSRCSSHSTIVEATLLPRYTEIMSRRLCLLWLMLALLPLRGWAVASMALPSAAPVVAEQRAEEARQQRMGVMPCHENVGSGDSEDTSSAQHACTLCDLCHSAATVHNAPVLPGAPVPDVMPRPAAARDTGRNAVGGLERPPRPFLA
jgi:hypothetical protein